MVNKEIGNGLTKLDYCAHFLCYDSIDRIRFLCMSSNCAN